MGKGVVCVTKVAVYLFHIRFDNTKSISVTDRPYHHLAHYEHPCIIPSGQDFEPIGTSDKTVNGAMRQYLRLQTE